MAQATQPPMTVPTRRRVAFFAVAPRVGSSTVMTAGGRKRRAGRPLSGRVVFSGARNSSGNERAWQGGVGFEEGQAPASQRRRSPPARL